MKNLVKFISIGLVAFLCAHSGMAKVKINKTENRKPASDTDAYLGAMNFVNFLKCGKSEEIKHAERFNCAKGFLSDKMSEEQKKAYLDALVIATEFSEPYYCDKETQKMVGNLETSKYDFFLCFNSDMASPERKSMVFFVNERGMPRISKIKM